MNLLNKSAPRRGDVPFIIKRPDTAEPVAALWMAYIE